MIDDKNKEYNMLANLTFMHDKIFFFVFDVHMHTLVSNDNK